MKTNFETIKSTVEKEISDRQTGDETLQENLDIHAARAGASSVSAHVKLSDSVSNTSGVSGGVAATPYAVKQVYDKAADVQENLRTEITDRQSADSTHANMVSSSSVSGHVKLSDSTNSTFGVSSGVAATPKAVKQAYDAAAAAQSGLDSEISARQSAEQTINERISAMQISGVEVDTELSAQSLKPVTNRAITEAVNAKMPSAAPEPLPLYTYAGDEITLNLDDCPDTGTIYYFRNSGTGTFPNASDTAHAVDTITAPNSSYNGTVTYYVKSLTDSQDSVSINDYVLLKFSEDAWAEDSESKTVYIVSRNRLYSHPSYTAKSSGLYKITVDGSGHVSGAAAVTKSDITALGIPSSDTNTTYSEATTSAAGLMSAADKARLDSIVESGGDNTTYELSKSGSTITLTGSDGSKTTVTDSDTKYTHPSYTAKSSGLYKITVDGSGHVSGTAAVTKSDITALGIPSSDTNTTYSNATTSAAGLMSAADKAKLDGISGGDSAGISAFGGASESEMRSFLSPFNYSYGNHPIKGIPYDDFQEGICIVSNANGDAEISQIEGIDGGGDLGNCTKFSAPIPAGKMALAWCIRGNEGYNGDGATRNPGYAIVLFTA